MNKDLKIRAFKTQMPADQLVMIYEKLIDLEEKHKLPDEITEQEYTVTQAVKWVKISAAWIRKQIYIGIIPEHKNEKGKHTLTWNQIQYLIHLREKKYAK